MSNVRAGIVGGAGYTGGEMVRLLLHHPKVELVHVTSRSQAGKKLWEKHEDLFGQTELAFTDKIRTDLDVVFICLPHGASKPFLEQTNYPASTVIIDLSRDYRLESSKEDFVYGLVEMNREEISKARRIANPGCFATAIQMTMLPLASAGLLTNDIHVSAITGSTGAGVSLLPTTHFTWRNNNISVYKAFQHQHLDEIRQSIGQLQPGYSRKVNFIPYRGNFSRGIIATVYTDFAGDEASARALYNAYYKDTPFVRLSKGNIHLKQVVNTNYCFLHLEVHDGQLMVISIIDNLLKGASGQAVQNMNLIMGWPEDEGLQLKASVF